MAEQKKQRKYDRNRDWCKAYRSSGQREKNQLRKLLRHVKVVARRNDIIINTVSLMSRATYEQIVAKLDQSWHDSFKRCNALVSNDWLKRIFREQHILYS